MAKALGPALIILAGVHAWWFSLPVVGYILEILLAALFLLAVVEGRWVIVAIAAGGGLVLGVIPGTAPIDAFQYLPLYARAVAPALILGAMVRNGSRARNSFGAAALAIGILTMAWYVQQHDAIRTGIQQLTGDLITKVQSTLHTQGYAEETVQGVVDELRALSRLIVHLFPGLLVLSAIVQLFVAFLTVELFYQRKESYFPGFGPFIYWKIPEKLLYLAGAVLLIRLIGSGVLQTAADNMILIFAFVYAVSGLSLLEHLLRRLKLPVVIRIVFYLGLLLLQLPGLIITAVAGLFDSYFDFRKVKARTLG